MKKQEKYFELFLFIWALMLAIAVCATLVTPTKTICRYYDEKIEASNLAKVAMNKIKEYKIANNIALSEDDINETGMLGERYTSITTTSGVLEAKRTSLNPNFAAVIIDMFKEAGVRKGDEVGIVFSSSFPALNISVLSACEVFKLKTCIMSSVGASSYGANNPQFTFFDMSEYLIEEKIFTNSIDLISLGGAYDIGYDFTDPNEKSAIIQRIENAEVDYLYEEDFEKNINYRRKYFFDNTPKMKLLINVGGNLVAMGKDECAFPNKNGLINPHYFNNNRITNTAKKGLLDYYLEGGISVVHMLNLKGLALKYDLPYDPSPLPEIGSGNIYFEIKYNTTTPIIAIGISVIFLGGYFIVKRKIRKGETNHEEKNILC